MNIAECKKIVDGCEYGKVRESFTEEQWKDFMESGLVLAYGHSDDLLEFEGAINDEVGAYEGTTVYLTKNGLPENECDNDECPYFHALSKGGRELKLIWCPEEYIDPDDAEAAWIIETKIQHEKFRIMEDGELFSVGIIFRLEDV